MQIKFKKNRRTFDFIESDRTNGLKFYINGFIFPAPKRNPEIPEEFPTTKKFRARLNNILMKMARIQIHISLLVVLPVLMALGATA